MIFWKIVLILIIILGLFYLCYSNDYQVEGFNPWLNYSRVYPGMFSYTYGYGPYDIPFNDTTMSLTRYNPGYSDYWYIPAIDSLNMWMNGGLKPSVPANCVVPPEFVQTAQMSGVIANAVPPSTSEYCFNKIMQETGNIDIATSNCTVPASVSESCPLLSDWTGPLGYEQSNLLGQIPRGEPIGSPITYYASDYLTERDVC